jgi:hypothetical protein
MYSVRREEVPLGKARDQLGGRSVAERAPVKLAAVVDRRSQERERERGRREKVEGERRKRDECWFKFAPVAPTRLA